MGYYLMFSLNANEEDIPENVINQMDMGVQKVKQQFKDNKDLQIVHNT